MKLYTEEQVRSIIQKARSNEDNWYSDNYLLAEQTPIELPSDEEIDEKAFQVPYDNTKDFYDLQFIKGAKWMRDKIKGDEQ
jgi:hypothetical protein